MWESASVSQATILVVDDDADVRDLLHEQLVSAGYQVVTAPSAEAALGLVERERPDLVLTDVHMSGLTGVELCARLKADPRFQFTPVVLLTAASDLDSRVAGLAAGADDFFAKPTVMIELRTRIGVLLKVKSLIDQLDRAESVIVALGRTIEARDPYTHGHCDRLARYAVTLGRSLGLDEPTLRALHLGGSLHDLGKVGVPDRILLKPDELTPEEMATMRRHPTAGEDLVRHMRHLEAVRPIIRHHHERCNGSGYPDGLRGEAIPLEARIMAVVDVHDALVTERPYKPAFPVQAAVDTLRRETDAGSWDPRIVDTWLDLVRSGAVYTSTAGSNRITT